MPTSTLKPPRSAGVRKSMPRSVAKHASIALGRDPRIVSQRDDVGDPDRRGVHTSTSQLEADIRSFIERHNQKPKPYTWTKSADEILAAVKRFCQKTEQTLRGEFWIHVAKCRPSRPANNRNSGSPGRHSIGILDAAPGGAGRQYGA
jgi:hypothetical protein